MEMEGFYIKCEIQDLREGQMRLWARGAEKVSFDGLVGFKWCYFGFPGEAKLIPFQAKRSQSNSIPARTKPN